MFVCFFQFCSTLLTTMFSFLPNFFFSILTFFYELFFFFLSNLSQHFFWNMFFFTPTFFKKYGFFFPMTPNLFYVMKTMLLFFDWIVSQDRANIRKTLHQWCSVVVPPTSVPFVMGSFSQMTHSWWYLLMVCNFSKARSLTVGYIFGLSLSCPQTITAVTKHNENVYVCSSRELSNSKSGTASVLTSSLTVHPCQPHQGDQALWMLSIRDLNSTGSLAHLPRPWMHSL